MIRSFRDKMSGELFAGRRVRALPEAVARAARRKLFDLDAAASPDVLRRPPGNRLEKLSGDRTGQWSIRINDQWRVCFRWDEKGPYDVEICDYH
ncbi:MAG: type II toxin-antitoxin system RelE/ParE family toxin [Beijerinckiaceae bacterium]